MPKSMPPKPYWIDLATTDFDTPAVADWIAVLPIAAVEQHGPHLPTGTDTLIAEGHVKRVVDRLPTDLPVLFLPVQAVGKSNEHISSPGTLTLGWETVTQAWIDIGDSVARAGVRKLILVTSHGGNVPIMDIVAREMRIRHDMLCVATSWSRLGFPDGLYSDVERKYGIHGGDMETSVMLALRPDLVRMDKAEDFRSTQQNFEQEFKHLRVHGQIQFGWKAQDLNVAGTVGDASIATAEKGDETLDYAADRFVELLRDVQACGPERLWKPG
jgi:creatinine amidohydrolase